MMQINSKDHEICKTIKHHVINYIVCFFLLIYVHLYDASVAPYPGAHECAKAFNIGMYIDEDIF